MPKIASHPALNGRYITLDAVEKALTGFPFEVIGFSVKKKPIPMYRIGQGKKKILMWSQMHGNESTTTKSVVDLIHYLTAFEGKVLEKCSLYIIPVLNPDGAEAYTRENAQNIDLNRDALLLSQPETQSLFRAYQSIQPDFCFNLHDQRSIFSLEQKPYPATLSFLAPSENDSRNITSTRKKSMEVIAYVYRQMQHTLQRQIGRFDDSFNPNCTGDRFTQLATPTILFEAGHFPGDYQREVTRKHVTDSLFYAISYIGNTEILGNNYQLYFSIPENEKRFVDVIIWDDISGKQQHLALVLKDQLHHKNIVFQPIIQTEINLKNKAAHQYRYLSEWFTQYDGEKIKRFIASYDFI